VADCPKVVVQVVDSITPEVKCGLRLFAETMHFKNPDRQAEDWLYWFEQNPLEKGLFSIGRCGEEVVGIITLIPLEMHLGRQTVKGAKAEFLVVAPAFRRAIDPETNRPLPMALVMHLYRAAKERAYKGIVGVGPPAAGLLQILAGARTLKYPATSYTRYVVPRISAGSPRERLRGLLAVHVRKALTTAGCIQSAGLRFRLSRTGQKGRGFERVGIRDVSDSAEAENMLVAPSDRMLPFVLRDDLHMIYRVPQNDGQPGYLVFSRPEKGKIVRLKHWTSLNLPPASLVGVLDDVVRHCRAVEADSISIRLPLPEAIAPELAKTCQLFSRPETGLIYLTTWLDYDIDLSPASWRITNLHKNFI